MSCNKSNSTAVRPKGRSMTTTLYNQYNHLGHHSRQHYYDNQRHPPQHHRHYVHSSAWGRGNGLCDKRPRSYEDYATVAKQTSTMTRMTCDCLLGRGRHTVGNVDSYAVFMGKDEAWAGAERPGLASGGGGRGGGAYHVGGGGGLRRGDAGPYIAKPVDRSV